MRSGQEERRRHSSMLRDVEVDSQRRRLGRSQTNFALEATVECIQRHSVEVNIWHCAAQDFVNFRILQNTTSCGLSVLSCHEFPPGGGVPHCLERRTIGLYGLVQVDANVGHGRHFQLSRSRPAAPWRELGRPQAVRLGGGRQGGLPHKATLGPRAARDGAPMRV